MSQYESYRYGGNNNRQFGSTQGHFFDNSPRYASMYSRSSPRLYDYQSGRNWSRNQDFTRKLRTRNYEVDTSLTFNSKWVFSDKSLVKSSSITDQKDSTQLLLYLETKEGKSEEKKIDLVHLNAKFNEPYVKKLQATVLWEGHEDPNDLDHEVEKSMTREFILREFYLKYVPSFRFLLKFIRNVLDFPLTTGYRKRFAAYNNGKHLETMKNPTVADFWKIQGIECVYYHPHVGILELIFRTSLPSTGNEKICKEEIESLPLPTTLSTTSNEEVIQETTGSDSEPQPPSPCV